MFDNSSVFAHLKHQARCIEAQLGEEQRHCFFVGTYSPQAENELHLIEFIEETNEIITRNVFQHPNEIYSISCCPRIQSLLFTTHRGGYMHEHFQPLQNDTPQSNHNIANDHNGNGNGNDNNNANTNANTNAVNTDACADTKENGDSNDADSNRNVGEPLPKDWWRAKISESVDNYHATLWKLVDLDTEESNPSQCIVHDIEIDDETDTILDVNQDFSIDDIHNMSGMDAMHHSPQNLSLQPLFTLPHRSPKLEKLNQHVDISIHSVLWDPTCWQTQCISLGDNCLQFWRFEKNLSGIREDNCIYDETRLKDLSCGCWDPHYPNRFISANDRHIRIWDAQNLKETQTILNAHQSNILSIDHNPNKPFNIITSSEDRTIRFWDLRKQNSKPLKILRNHSHWVWCAKYNRYHDQLIISSGSDANISLWNIVSVSSAPMGELDDNTREEDKLIRTYKDSHEECIYWCSWSANNAWVFASLSYDGRVVVNHVPSATKYKILL